GDQVYQKVGELSGGERSRAALAKLVAAGVNVLVLDEPTNHLDLWACDALGEAIKEFEGTVIVVSHDRYFLNQVADMLLALDGRGNVDVVYGNYDTYEIMRAQQEAAKAEEETKRQAKEAGKGGAAKPAEKPGKRKRKFPYRKVPDIEADILTAEVRLKELEEALASPDLYRDGERVKQTTKEFEETKTRLAQLYEHWEE